MQVRTTYNDMAILKANLDGNIKNSTEDLKDKNNKIKEIKSQFSDDIHHYKKLGENKAAVPLKFKNMMKIAKLHFFKFLYISMFTLAFFIYKQINME